MLRLLADPGRIRILRILASEELSVAELQEVLGMAQSRISMQLAQLKQNGLVVARKSGQKSLYSYHASPSWVNLVAEVMHNAEREIDECILDDEGLRIVVRRRTDTLRSYFDEIAGRLGRNYLPGRSWKGFSEMLFRLMPPLVIADLGAGEGTLALLLAQRAKSVIAVDNSAKMVEYGSEIAARNGVTNIVYRLGSLEDVPIPSGSVDLVVMHQSLHHALHPQEACSESWRILKPGGRVVILDLLKHDFEGARELYADVWLGFSQSQLYRFLANAGFENIDVSLVDREDRSPHFQTLLSVADKRLNIDAE